MCGFSGAIHHPVDGDADVDAGGSSSAEKINRRWAQKVPGAAPRIRLRAHRSDRPVDAGLWLSASLLSFVF